VWLCIAKRLVEQSCAPALQILTNAKSRHSSTNTPTASQRSLTRECRGRPSEKYSDKKRRLKAAKRKKKGGKRKHQGKRRKSSLRDVEISVGSTSRQDWTKVDATVDNWEVQFRLECSVRTMGCFQEYEAKRRKVFADGFAAYESAMGAGSGP
jgi:hypothetical protein